MSKFALCLRCPLRKILVLVKKRNSWTGNGNPYAKLRFGNWPRTTYRMEPTAPVGAIKNCVEWPGFFCDEHSIVINMVLSALTFNLHHPRGGSNVAHKGMITWENIAKIKTSFANLSFKTGGSYQSQIPPKNPCMFVFFFSFSFYVAE